MKDSRFQLRRIQKEIRWTVGQTSMGKQNRRAVLCGGGWVRDEESEDRPGRTEEAEKYKRDREEQKTEMVSGEDRND